MTTYEKATLAGGCFWCIESAFLEVSGIISVQSGYTGGEKLNPSYQEVCTGKTEHQEAVEIIYDPQKITYFQILDIFWHNIDPLDESGQFADRGSQYETAIFYHNEKQQQWAEKSKKAVQALFDQPVATKILKAKPFYTAEGYHQGYCKREPIRFQNYRQSHEKRLKELWEGKKIEIELKELLTPLQYKVAVVGGTEPPFKNEYWNQKKEGIYVDIISGEPLFSSKDKFDSGSGWPSFTQSINPDELVAKRDNTLGTERIEIRSKSSDTHLGHVFPDGPPPTYIRYCINSASLRFIANNDK